MHLFLNILNGMANSVDPDQTAPSGSSLIWVCTVCISHYIRNFGVQNFRIFTVFYTDNNNKNNYRTGLISRR